MRRVLRSSPSQACRHDLLTERFEESRPRSRGSGLRVTRSTLIGCETHTHELPHKSLPMPDLSESRTARPARCCQTTATASMLIHGPDACNSAALSGFNDEKFVQPRTVDHAWQRRRTRLFMCSRQSTPLVLRSSANDSWHRIASFALRPRSIRRDFSSSCPFRQLSMHLASIFMRRWQSQASRFCCQRRFASRTFVTTFASAIRVSRALSTVSPPIKKT